MQRIISFAVAFAFFISCTSNADKKSDIGISIADTLLNKTETTRPGFAAVTDSSQLMIIQRDGKSISYPDYKQGFKEDSYMVEPTFKWEDIDGDGNNEIVVSAYTGGAHCCDINTILNRSGSNEMREVLDYTGGISISKDTVTLSFFEALGYFHSCYACGIEYPEPLGPEARLLFKNGKFSFPSADKKLNDDIETNLQFIAAKGIPDKDAADESGFDDGTRKAIAFNLAAHYFNNRDMKATQQLFDKYYAHKDKTIVWNDLAKAISAFGNDIEKSVLLQ